MIDAARSLRHTLVARRLAAASRHRTGAVLMLGALLGGVTAFAGAALRPQEFVATAILLDRDAALKPFRATLSERDRRAAAARAAQELTDLRITSSELYRRVTVTRPMLSAFAVVRATSQNPREAAVLANAYAVQYSNVRRRGESTRLAVQLRPLRARVIASSRRKGARARRTARRQTMLLAAQRRTNRQLVERRVTFLARPAVTPRKAAGPARWRSAAGGVLGGLAAAALVLAALRAGPRRRPETAQDAPDSPTGSPARGGPAAVNPGS